MNDFLWKPVFFLMAHTYAYMCTQKKKRQIQIHQKTHLQNVPLAEHRFSDLKHSWFWGGKK